MALKYTRTHLQSTLRLFMGVLLLLVVAASGAVRVSANTLPSINFDASQLVGENFDGSGSNRPTSIQFGPDSRLYVMRQDGMIFAYTVVRAAKNNYIVSATEQISLVYNIPNNNDDGAPAPTVQGRLSTGLLVTGTASNPVIYVTSSDPRSIYSGAGSTLDTNSGIISRLTRANGTWSKVDLVRGLPRSAEYHAPNGMQLDPSTNTLYVAIGGHTNMGAPDSNLAFVPEYALSAAILAVDLSAINSLPVNANGAHPYVYNLPTLDDDSRTNTAFGVDTNDPFGGNRGKNMAREVVGGPVRIFSPGYRNAYDLELTTAGRLYTIDNGSNAGFGGAMPGEQDTIGQPGVCTNESGNNTGGVTGFDNLHLVTEGYYAGHPNPTRGNAHITYNVNSALNDLGVQTGVPAADDRQCDFRWPGNNNNAPQDGALATWGYSTNGLVEYTASNFANQMKGNLLAVSFNNTVSRIQLNPTGTAATVTQFATIPSGTNTPLDITAQNDFGIFPGTVWVAAHSGAIVIYEPADYGGIDPQSCDLQTVDADGDGFANTDENAASTNPCNAASFPADADNDKVSDLTDTDDDNDGQLDLVDPFQVDPLNGFVMPISLDFDPAGTTFNTGLLGSGFTGVMTNGTTNYLNTYDPSKMTVGGIVKVFTVDEVSAGDAEGSLNNQEYAFQTGVLMNNQPFTVSTRLAEPYFDNQAPTGQMSQGLYFGTGDQDNYAKLVLTSGGFRLVIENGGAVVTSQLFNVSALDSETIDLMLSVNPVNGTVFPRYRLENGTLVEPAASPIALPSGALLNAVRAQGQAVATGIIATSRGGTPFTALWDTFNVQNDMPGVISATPSTVNFGNVQVNTNSLPQTITLRNEGVGSDPTITITNFAINSNQFELVNPPSTPVQLAPQATLNLNVRFKPTVVGPPTGTLTVTHNGTGGQTTATLSGVAFSVGTPLYRINAGGGAISNGGWTVDSNNAANKSPNLLHPMNTYSKSFGSNPNSTGAPNTLFNTERWDAAGGQTLSWEFPVSGQPALPQGDYLITLYFREASGNAVDVRRFNVFVDDVQVENEFDVFATALAIHGNGKAALARTYVATVTAANPVIDIDLLHGSKDNPYISGIQIQPINFNGPSVLRVSPASFDFGEVNLNTNITQQVTLTNSGTTGDPNIVISNIALSGAGAAKYSENGGNITLTPGQSTVVDVTFTPDVTGIFNAQLNITHNGIGGTASVSLTGEGVIPSSSLGLSTNAVTFPVQATFVPTDPTTITLSNLGEAGDPAITINSVQVSGSGANDFNVTLAQNTIAQGANTTLDVIFQPLATGARSAVIIINHDGDNSPLTINLSGSGFAFGQAQYRVNAGGPEVPATDGGINWGADLNNVGSPYLASAEASSNPYSATFNSVNNTGAPNQIFGTERWDPSAAPAMLWSFPVEPGQYDVVLYLGELFFNAANSRQFDLFIEGQLVLDNFDQFAAAQAESGAGRAAIKRTFPVTITGTGQTIDIETAHVLDNPAIKGIEIIPTGADAGAILTADPTLINFAQITVGDSSSTVQVTLRNSGPTGSGDITIASVAAQGTNAADFVVTPPADPTLSPGESTTFTVAFAPTGSGQRSAIILVTHNGNNLAIPVQVNGPAVAPTSSLDVDPEAVEFGYQNVGTASAPVLVDLVNLGQVGDPDITITSLTFSGANAGLFSHNATLPLVVDQGDTEQLGLIFTPNTEGTKTATLTIEHDGDNSPAVITLGGEGHIPNSTLEVPPALAGGVNFGNQQTGITSAPFVIDLTNSGLAAANDPVITITNVTITGPNATEFAVIAGYTTVFNPEQTSPLRVTFTPQDETAKTANLVITHTGNNSPTTIALSGQGDKDPQPPYVTNIIPAPGATNAPVDLGVVADVFLPREGAGVNPLTLTQQNVYIYRTADPTQTPVPATYSTSGGADTISILPTAPLQPNTNYTVVITSNVQDMSGVGFVPYTSTFTTGAGTGSGGTIPGVQFEKLPSGATPGNVYNSVEMGPDGRLYAAAFGGIFHWQVEGNGTLTKETFRPLPANTFGGPMRMVIGVEFDPRSTPTNLIMWITHNEGMSFINDTEGPHFSSALMRITISNPGSPLESWQFRDMAVGFPRSVRDHLTNSAVFGPDFNGDGTRDLYVAQGSISAMGARDNAWGNEPETILAGNILRVDPLMLESYVATNGNQPLNVATGFVAPGNNNLQDANNFELGDPEITSWPAPGSYYNPYAVNAPITLYATGTRNVYDLVYHSNGELYAPANGSAAGGNSPASPATLPPSCKVRPDTVYNGAPQYTGPSVPAALNIVKQNDYLFRLEHAGYYGHPNPTHCAWVLNGGNPTAGADPGQVGDHYPVGTQPDRNYQGFAYDFLENKSPNGAIEYQSSVFSGALKGLIMVARYNLGQDILVMRVGGPNNDVIATWDNIPGLGFGFVDPLDITEDVSKGNLYVIEYDEVNPANIKIALVRPVGGNTPDVQLSVNELIFNQTTGGGASAPRSVTVTNVGLGTLNISPINTTGSFAVSNLPAVDTSLNPGEFTTIQVTFDPSVVGPQLGTLTILSNDPTDPAVSVTLRGLGTAGLGGTNEPSLQWILDTYNYKINVGDNNPATNIINSSTPDAPLLGEEVSVSTFERAGAGNVEVRPLAVFGPSSNPVTTVGWYPAGNPGGKTTLFSVNSNSSQTLNPEVTGSTSFNPANGARFGFYSVWPFFSNREVYSQDQFNTFTTPASGGHRVRVYQLKNGSGAIVPNSYIVAFEEEAAANDYQDVVLLVSNVKPASVTTGVLEIAPTYFGFGAVKNSGPTAPRALTLRNTGVTPINISEITVDGPFNVQGGYPTTIPVGGQITVNFTFTPPNTPAAYTGTINIQSNAANGDVDHIIAGVSANAEGGNNEPSLQRIFNAYAIPVNTGDNDEATVSIHSTPGVARGLALGEQMLVRSFVKSDNSQPVTVEPLGGYAIDNPGGSIVNVGWYPNSNPNNSTQTFNVQNGTDQTLNLFINGSLNMNVGNGVPFGVYAEWVPSPWNGRLTYQNDTYNRFFDTTTNLYANPNHVRIFPLKNTVGTIVPDAYIVAFEEWTGQVNGFDYNDIVFVIRNVKPVLTPETATGIDFENLDWQTVNELEIPGFEWVNEYLAFHKMRVTTGSGINPPELNVPTKDTATLRIHNRGATPLQIFSISATNNHGSTVTPFLFPNGDNVAPPLIPAGSFRDVVITYNGNLGTVAKGVFIDTLTITSNDPQRPIVQIPLSVIYTQRPVGPNEPSTVMVGQGLGFSTNFAAGGGTVQYPTTFTTAGDGVLAPYWEVMDPTRPIYIRQLAALHGCCTGGQERLEMRRIENKPGRSTNFNISNPQPLAFIDHDPIWGQTILPGSLGTGPNWVPTEVLLTSNDLGTGVNNVLYTRTIRNFDSRSYDGYAPEGTAGVRHRFWAARDPQGNLIPGAFIMGIDYVNASHVCAPNGDGLCDFNDNVYLLTNVQPAEFNGMTYDTDVAVEILEAQDPILQSESLVYTVIARNETVHQAPNTQLTITLPDNAPVDSITPAGVCGTPSGGQVNCNLGALTGGERVEITVVASPLTGGARTLSASISTSRDEVTTANNTDSETTSVLNFNSIPATITVVKDAQPDTTIPFDFTGDLGAFQLIDDPTAPPVVDVQVNFQPATTNGGNPPAGYDIADFGQRYGENNQPYGWFSVDTDLPADASLGLRERTTGGFNLAQRTFNHMQQAGQPQYYWEYAVPNGQYQVTVSAGDTQFFDSTNAILVEGVEAFVPPFQNASSQRVREVTVNVVVTDGALTVAPDPAKGINTKINYVHIVGGNPNTKSFLVEGGTYEINEVLPPLWRLDDVTCDAAFTPRNNGVELTVASEDNVVCTFTNTEITGPEISVQVTADQDEILVGEDVTLTVEVRNVGLAPLNNVSIVNDVLAQCDNTFASLALNEVQTYTCAANDIAATINNTTTATGTPDNGAPDVTDTALTTITIVSPGISISKTPDVQNGLSVGSTAVFDIVVTNTGNATLNNVAVDDPLTPTCDRNIGALGAGESFTYSCQATNVQATFTNVALAQGDWRDNTYFAQDSAVVILDGVTYGTASYRVNAGGSTIGAIDGGPAWVGVTATGATTVDGPAGTATISAGQSATPGTVTAYTNAVPLTTTPTDIFNTSRFDPLDATPMNWSFPVPNGEYEVRLFFANTFAGTAPVGSRVFNVNVEGSTTTTDGISLLGYDVVREAGGTLRGNMEAVQVIVSDGVLNINFSHLTPVAINNPMVNGIEILPVTRLNPAVLSSTPTSYDYGEVPVDNVPRSTTITLQHVGGAGSAPINISNIQIIGPDAAEFSLDTTGTVTTLAAGGTTSFDVRLTPASFGVKVAAVEITHDAENGGAVPLTVFLTAKAVPIPLPSLYFGQTDQNPVTVLNVTMELGQAPTQEVLGIFNTGDAPTNFTINTSALPEWLQVSPAAGVADTVSNPDETQVTFTFDNSTLGLGDYTYNLLAIAPEHVAAALEINLSVIPKQYNITTDITNGTINPAGPFTVDEGSSQSFTITPDVGYIVETVTVNGVDITPLVQNNGFTLQNITEDKAIVVTLLQVPTYTIEATAGVGGIITPSGVVTVTQGDDVTFDITPDAGFIIDSVLVDGAPQGPINTYTFSDVSTDHTIAVTFREFCSPISPDTCETVPVSLVTDFCLPFDGVGRGLVDASGIPTGFTMVDAPSSFAGPVAGVPGYVPANLSVANGELTITATQGIQFSNVNTQENALGVAFDPTRAAGETITLRTTITGFPPGGADNNQAQQGGLWFGLNEDQYVKLVARQDNQIQFYAERSTADFDETNAATGATLTGENVDIELILVLDPNASTASAYYVLNGGAQQIVVEDYDLPAGFFQGVALPGVANNVSYGGIFGTTRNYVGTIDFRFGNFCIEPSDALTNTIPVVSTNTGATVDEGASVVIDETLLAATDAEHLATELTYTVVTAPVNGTLNLSSFTQADLDADRVLYTHDGSETTSDSFTFTVSDPAGGLTTETTFNITVTPVNDAPVVVNNIALTVEEGGSGDITSAQLLATDEDLPGDTLTYTVLTLPDNGTLALDGVEIALNGTFTQEDVNNGLVSYTHDGSNTASDAFGFSLSDGTDAVTSVFTIAVNLTNDAPVEVTNFSLILPQGGTGTINSGRLEYSDEEQLPGQIVYTITAATSNGALRNGNTALGQGDTFTQANINSGAIRYTHNGTETGGDNFKFTVSDGTNTTSEATFVIVISGVNNPPVITTNQTLTVNEGSSAAITSSFLEATDPEQTAGELAYTLTGAPQQGVILRNGININVGETFTQADINSGILTYQHNGSETTSDSFDFEVTDGVTATPELPATEPVPGTFNIAIAPVNDAPVEVVNQPLVLVRGETVTLPASRLLYSDVDNGVEDIVYTVTDAPQQGTLMNTVTGLTNTFSQSDINNGQVVYMHSGSLPDADAFTFEVTDGTAAPASDVFNITIVNDGERPVANDDVAETTINTPVSVNVIANDTGSLNPATVFVTNPPASGQAVANGNGTVTFTPANGFSGTVTFQYTVDSTIGLTSNIATVTVNVIGGPSVVANTGLQVGLGQIATITSQMLRAEDPNSGPAELVYSIVMPPTRGTLLLNGTPLNGSFSQAEINANLLTYQHSGAAELTDSFEFTVTDGTVTTPVQVFNITVTDAINAAPTNLFVTGNLNMYPLQLAYNWTHKVTQDATTVPADWYHIVVNKDNVQVVDLWVTAEEACEGVLCTVPYFDKQPPYVFENGEYIWYVEAWNAPTDANNQWTSVVSELATFTIDVLSIQPPQGVVVVPNQGRSTISWDNDPAATWYEFWYGNANGTVFQKWIEKTSEMCDDTRCSFTPPADPVGGSYDYWMRSWGPGGLSEGVTADGWNGPYSVDLPTTPPVAVEGLTSTGAVTGNPTFIWEGVANATWYQLWVGKQVSENNWTTYHLKWYLAADLGCENMGTCNLKALIDLPNGDYDWAVQAWGPGGLSVGGTIANSWTDIFAVVVDAQVPGIPTLGAPLGSPGAPIQVFSWTGVPGASWYQLWVGDADQNTLYDGWFRAEDLGCADNIATCFIDFGTALPAAEYTWATRAYSPAGLGEWSSPERFQAPAP